MNPDGGTYYGPFWANVVGPTLNALAPTGDWGAVGARQRVGAALRLALRGTPYEPLVEW